MVSSGGNIVVIKWKLVPTTVDTSPNHLTLYLDSQVTLIIILVQI